MQIASKIIGRNLPSIDGICVSNFQKKGLIVLKDTTHPARYIFTPLDNLELTKLTSFFEQHHILHCSGSNVSVLII